MSTKEPTDDAPIDLDEARRDPARVFGTPERLVAETALTREQKVELLKRWQYDASALAVATEEGMGGGESSMESRVAKALHELTDGYDVEHSPPTKQRGL